MKNAITAVPLSCLLAIPAFCQTEAVVKQYFEGKTVIVRQDMPATSDGVDVYPGAGQGIDFKSYSQRIKTNGISLRNGQPVMVTLVKVKKQNIEFQLGGGGYGTFGDAMSTPSVYVPSVEKSRREKDLENDIQWESDPIRRREMQEELDHLRRQRSRDDAIAQALAANAEQKRQDMIHQKALESGSRFNIRFPDGVPVEALTPPGLMNALAQYMEFPPQSFPAAIPQQAQVPTAPPTSFSSPCPTLLRKGMGTADVMDLLGEPDRTEKKAEGSVNMLVWNYFRDDYQIELRFADGVLIKYMITSR